MVNVQDGPCSAIFMPLAINGNAKLPGLEIGETSTSMAATLDYAPSGSCIAWGIRFEVENVVLISNSDFTADFSPTNAKWLVFMHASDKQDVEPDRINFDLSTIENGLKSKHVANYVFIYEDGSEIKTPIFRRHQIGAFTRAWGENCFQAVVHRKPYPIRAWHEQMKGGYPQTSAGVSKAMDVHPFAGWGQSQTRVEFGQDMGPWMNWLWAWENPHPDKAIIGIRFEPVSDVILVSAISAGNASSLPLRWQPRRKALLRMPEGVSFLPTLDERGLLQQIQLDMGQVISAEMRSIYPNTDWTNTYNNQIPRISANEVLVEYSAHEDACFHLLQGHIIPVSHVEHGRSSNILFPVPSAHQRVTIRTIERTSGRYLPAKLHVHGDSGEYLTPVDRNRHINPSFFEDYSVDFIHRNTHSCTYISGETSVCLPIGKVYFEISSGFEIAPVRKIIEVTPTTQKIDLEIEKVLLWREKGWVTADTHVHFLSPMSALLEGSAEGVNVVNLLATQGGELMTCVGDFDGKTTWGSKDAGGDGEHLVRVGTENRQHVLGHISLLGYDGKIITPLATGGPDESAIGDPIEFLLSEWARQCKQQGGLTVLPHFPRPRGEYAACLVNGDIDAVEMTSWGDLYGGIDPYSLTNWYRYLNCGYLVPAVGGTDKMMASTPVGAIRTYAMIDRSKEFTYGRWKDAIRRRETFVTYGPLLEFSVNGKPMGSIIDLPRNGGTVDVTWEVASVTVPMSRVELIVNGEILESVEVSPREGSGHWSIKIDKSSWLALLVRGHYPEKPEIVAAHSTPVQISIEGSQLLSPVDAVTILGNIEGPLAYLDTVGTRADDITYKRMRLVLAAAHRTLHNRMHLLGHYHEHIPLLDLTD